MTPSCYHATIMFIVSVINKMPAFATSLRVQKLSVANAFLREFELLFDFAKTQEFKQEFFINCGIDWTKP